MINTMSNEDEDDRFQSAAFAARRIVTQCRAHVEKSTAKLSARTDRASPKSPYGIDAIATAAGTHLIAFEQRIEHVESMCNALVSHLRGLEVLLQQDTLHPLPAIPITRSIAEVSASCSWMLNPKLDFDQRAARSYAALFRAIDASITASRGGDSSRTTEFRQRLVDEVTAHGVRVVRRVKDGKVLEEVAQVTVGRAHAKTGFQYSRRVADEIPRVAGLYSGMSGVAHGEHIPIATSWDAPDAYARMIGAVARWSVGSWSQAVHSWVGVEPGEFVNHVDYDRLVRSMPPRHPAEFSAAVSPTA